jgi:hypothetical protein
LHDPKICGRLAISFRVEVEMDSNLSESELQTALGALIRLQEQNRRALQAKRAEAAKLTGEATKIAEAGKGIVAAINTIRKELGLPLEEHQGAPASASLNGGATDTTSEVMRIISDHQEKGGIDIDDIDAKLKQKGVTVSSRDYLNTILTRKKNKQKKLIRVDGKWLLTDKGKTEVKMRTE